MEISNANAHFREIDCETLDEFWDVISPIGELFSDDFTSFIFRGQRDSSWTLVPKAFRPCVIEKYKGHLSALYSDHPGQTYLEWSILNLFLQHCDRLGLVVPGDSMEFRERFSFRSVMSTNAGNNRLWPQDHVIPLMALAQHHGVPTRLLDWTSHPYVAAYFAATGVVTSTAKNRGKRLAVFGLSLNSNFYSPIDLKFRYVRVPGSTSSNLSAQSGSFILVNNSGYAGEPFAQNVCLEDFLTDKNRLIKVSLPVDLAGKLLERCLKFGFSASSLFPGYDGAGRAVEEQVRLANFLELFK